MNDIQKKDRYSLKLYVAGMGTRSLRAIQNTRRICEEHLKGSYNLEIIDLNKDPSRIMGEQIIAAPTLVKKAPLPLRRLIGDMSQISKVLEGLDLIPDG